MPDEQPALLALDWGTSTLRAYLVAADGTVLAQRSRPWGILSLPDGGYPAAFAAIVEAWPAAGLPAIACGMVGSRRGWKEVGYLALPCDAAGPAGTLAHALAGALDTVALPDARLLHLVPGLLDPAGPDVMRGEETEAVGALLALGDPDGDIVLVMPGTHSKWLRCTDRTPTGFSTYMTGELYALLTRHSILGGQPGHRPGAEGDERFGDGVRAAAADGLSARLFSTRALMLTGRLPEALAPDYLSGLLIGDELRSALSHHAVDRVALIGDPSLTRRYALALSALGRPAPDLLEAASVRGLHRIACLAGLIHSPSGETPC